METKKYSLSQLNLYIKQVIALNMREAVWVNGEIAQVNNSKGHFYLELVEKSEFGIQAKSQAVIWKSAWAKLLRSRGKDIAKILQVGFNISVQVKVEYHERFGLKLNILDIDPIYTLGQLELKRKAIFELLKRLKLLHKNREQYLPAVPQRIAVISSERAAGLQDFLNHLAKNSFGYKFEVKLFPASVQGEFAENELLTQLDKIEFAKNNFDAVVIIRGGGAKLDLAVFDSEPLCRRVALFPLPVLSGIGHETDETMLDKVVHTSLRTPTAVADFLLDRLLAFEEAISSGVVHIQFLAQQRIRAQEQVLGSLEHRIASNSLDKIRREKMMLDFIEQRLPSLAKHQLKSGEQLLDNLAHQIRLLSPEFALARGFSITTHNGKVVMDSKQVEEGSLLLTQLAKGNIRSRVEKDTSI